MRRISCIVFDLDGTLSRTHELIFAAFNHVAEKYLNKMFSPGEIVAMFGPPEEIAIERLVGEEHAAAAMEEFCAYYEAHHPRLATAYEGVAELLEYLKEHGILLALFTGKGRRTALITLQKLEFMRYFDLIVTGNDVLHHKPSADGIRNVLKTFRLQPEELIMVGDSVSDVQAAREARVTVASALWDCFSKEEVTAMNPDVHFRHVADLSAWLKTMVPSNGVGVA